MLNFIVNSCLVEKPLCCTPSGLMNPRIPGLPVGYQNDERCNERTLGQCLPGKAAWRAGPNQSFYPTIDFVAGAGNGGYPNDKPCTHSDIPDYVKCPPNLPHCSHHGADQEAQGQCSLDGKKKSPKLDLACTRHFLARKYHVYPKPGVYQVASVGKRQIKVDFEVLDETKFVEHATDEFGTSTSEMWTFDALEDKRGYRWEPQEDGTWYVMQGQRCIFRMIPNQGLQPYRSRDETPPRHIGATNILAGNRNGQNGKQPSTTASGPVERPFSSFFSSPRGLVDGGGKF
jgi:hypothetical protein